MALPAGLSWTSRSEAWKAKRLVETVSTSVSSLSDYYTHIRNIKQCLKNAVRVRSTAKAVLTTLSIATGQLSRCKHSFEFLRASIHTVRHLGLALPLSLRQHAKALELLYKLCSSAH